MCVCVCVRREIESYANILSAPIHHLHLCRACNSYLLLCQRFVFLLLVVRLRHCVEARGMSPRGVKGHPTRVRCHVTRSANGTERRRENRSTMPLRLDVKVSMNLFAVREAASLAQHTARSFGSRLIRCWCAQIRIPPASLYCSMAVGEIVTAD